MRSQISKTDAPSASPFRRERATPDLWVYCSHCRSKIRCTPYTVTAAGRWLCGPCSDKSDTSRDRTD